MAHALSYRVPRRFIVPPEEPRPYGLIALSFAGHVLFFSAALAFSAFLGSRLDQSKIYIVNLVPAAPAAGSPAPRTVARPARAEPAPRPEERTPPRPAPAPPRVEERTPPKPAAAEPPPKPTPPVRVEKPAELPPVAPKPTEVAPAAAPRPSDLTLPRRIEKETPPLEATGPRDRLVDRTPPPPPPPAVAPLPTRLPEPPRVAPFQPAPAVPAPPSPPAAVATTARPGLEPVRLGRPNAPPTATGSISLDVSDFPFTYYLRQIQAKISERWTPPRAAAAGGERAIIMFEIGRDGSIREQPALEKSSGNTVYDQSALRAVTEASPFPPLPPEFKAPSLRVHFGFEFRPEQG